MLGKQKFKAAMDLNKCRRCCLICRGRRVEIGHKYMGGKWPKVREPTDPSLILWRNLGKGRVEQFFNQAGTMVLVLLLLAAGFSSIVGLFYLKDQYPNETAHCGEKVINPQ